MWILLAVAAYASTPITAIGGGLFWTSLGEKMTPVNAFTILAIATLVTNPLMVLFQSFPKLQETWACASRIQAFLVQEISNNVHGGGNDDHDLAVSPNLEKISEPQTEGRNIQLAGAFISPTETTSPVILNTTFTIERAQVTVVVGPVGCGKSTLIRALLGEASVCQGQLWRKDCNIAYCGQSPWLRNVSIRKNIIGPNRFDPVWYEVVLNACALNDDLQRLPFRDSTKVGNNGSKLSGGQKRRVVSHLPPRGALNVLLNALRHLRERSTHARRSYYWMMYSVDLMRPWRRISIQACLAQREYCADLHHQLCSQRIQVCAA
jgi:ABC-type multidrug transport system fused ATPase/permease subunit